MNSFIELSLIAGLLAIDERAGWQSLLAQPVFAALLIGLVTGQLAAALAVGFILELVWLSILPMRGLRRPDHIAGAVVGAGTAALLLNLTADPRLAFVTAVGVFVGLVAGEIGAKVTAPLFALQNRKLSRVEIKPDSGRAEIVRRLSLLSAGSIAFIFVTEAVVVLVLLAVVFNAAEMLTGHMDGSLVTGTVLWQYLMPALGAASLVHVYWQQHLKRILIGSTVLVALILWLR